MRRPDRASLRVLRLSLHCACVRAEEPCEGRVLTQCRERFDHLRQLSRRLDVGGANDRGFGAGELEETVLCKLSTTSR